MQKLTPALQQQSTKRHRVAHEASVYISPRTSAEPNLEKKRLAASVVELSICAVRLCSAKQPDFAFRVMARTVQGFKDGWFVVMSLLLLVSLSFAVCVHFGVDYPYL